MRRLGSLAAPVLCPLPARQLPVEALRHSVRFVFQAAPVEGQHQARWLHVKGVGKRCKPAGRRRVGSWFGIQAQREADFSDPAHHVAVAPAVAVRVRVQRFTVDLMGVKR